MSEPKIPFGFKQVPAYAPTQKGDGKWDGTKFRKVKKDWPRVDVDDVVIRKCSVIQPELTLPVKGCRIFDFEDE